MTDSKILSGDIDKSWFVGGKVYPYDLSFEYYSKSLDLRICTREIRNVRTTNSPTKFRRFHRHKIYIPSLDLIASKP